MSKKANPVLVGAFVLGAIALAVAAAIAFGGASLFTSKSRFTLHFRGYIGGLNIGAPVEFNGVRIGNVTDIRIVSDASGANTRIPVVIEIRESVIKWTGGKTPHLDEQICLNINEGLRAQLAQQSLLTGLLKINLLYEPASPIVMVGGGEYPEIPTIPSPFSQVKEQLENLPLMDIVNNVQTSIQAVVTMLADARTRDVVGQFISAITDLRVLTSTLNTQVVAVAESLQKTTVQTGQELQKTLGVLQQATDNLDKRLALLLASATATSHDIHTMVNQSAALPGQLQDTLKETTEAARSLRVLSDYLERHPEALLRGKTE